MHTIEAAILVPLGLGLISILLMLTFYLHDQTVLTADYAAMILEWQHCPNQDKDTESMDEVEEELAKGLLITEVKLSGLSVGGLICRMEVEETWRLFQRGLELLASGSENGINEREFTQINSNPCWLKRIWRVSDIE